MKFPLQIAVLSESFFQWDSSPLAYEQGRARLAEAIDQRDHPFLVIGDSPWSLIVEPTPAQVDQYLDDRAAKGFNLILVNNGTGASDWLLILECEGSPRN